MGAVEAVDFIESPREVLVPFPRIRFRTTGLIYDERITVEQREFHENVSKYRAVQAAIGSGKSAMGTIEALRHCWYYRANFGFIIRKTMPQANISSIPDLLDIAPRWMILNWNKQDKLLEVINQYGHLYMLERGQYRKKRDYMEGLEEVGGISKIVFTSFEGTVEALNKWESANLGWYMIDQAEWANADIKKMLDHRLRRVPSARRAWFLANFRRDIPTELSWLWQIFSEESSEYQEDHWYSDRMTTESNSHNTPDDWHASLKKTMTAEEQAHYLTGDTDKMSMTKQVFDELSRETHVMSHRDPPVHWQKGIGLDPGIGNPTAFLEVAFSPAGDIYVYSEWEESGRIVSDISALLLTLKTPQHLYWYIDATAGNVNQVTGTSVLQEFQSFGLPFVLAPRNVGAGVMRIKEYLRFDPHHVNPWTGVRGAPRLLISDRCLGLVEQLMLYRIDERKTHVGNSNETEKFRQWKDHCVDALRFIVMGATQPIGINKQLPIKRANMSFPRGIPDTVARQPDIMGVGENGRGVLDFSKVVAQSMVPIKRHTTPRREFFTPWSEIQRNAL